MSSINHTTTVLHVVGMRCNEDREKVLDVLMHVRGVDAVEVNLYRAAAMVTHDPACDLPSLLNAVEAAGFQISRQDGA